MSKRVLSIIGLIVVLAVVSAACTTAQSPGESEAASEAPASEAATPAPPPAEGYIAEIQSRGELICGVNGGLAGFSVVESDGSYSGIDADYCRALAVAVLGDAERIDWRELTTETRGPAIQTGEVDVLIRNTTWTSSRDAEWGNFGPTIFYDGQGIMVRAELGAETLEDLDGASICVQQGTTTELNLTDQMRALGVDFTPQTFGEIDPTYQAYEEGRCDAVTSDRSQLISRRTEFGNPDEHEILDVVMSKEPLGPVVPAGDDAWFDVVKWVVFATIEAEELGVTSENVEEMRDTSENPVVRRLLGVEAPELGQQLGLESDWAVNVILTVGNYGEIYDRNLGPDTPFDLDRGPNQIWTEGGLLYAPPYR